MTYMNEKEQLIVFILFDFRISETCDFFSTIKQDRIPLNLRNFWKIKLF